MRHRATWVLLPLFLGALGALWWSEYARIPTMAEKRRLMNRVLPELIDLKRSDVLRIEVDRPALKQKLEFVKRDGGGWQILRPIDVSADRTRVERLIENLVKLAKSPDSGTLHDDPRTFGLDGSELQIRLYVKSSPEPLVRLDVGGTLRDLRAVRASNSEGIELVPAESLAVVDLPLEDLRDRSILNFASAQVEKLNVVDRGSDRNLSVLRDEQNWRMTEPFKTRADADKIESLIAELAVLEVVDGPSGFVADDLKPSKLAKYGLNPPRMTIALEPFSNSKSPSASVALGDSVPGNENQVYAMQSGQDDVVVVDIKRLHEALPSPLALRSPEIFDFDPAKAARIRVDIPGLSVSLVKRSNRWEQVEPSADLAETPVVEKLLKALHELKVGTFLNPSEVLDPKIESGSIRFKVWGVDSKSPALVDLKLGRLDRLRKTVYGRIEGDPTILAIPDSLLEIVPRSPLAYRSLEALTLNPSRIARLDVTQAGKRVSVVSPGSNQRSVHWRMTEPVKANTDEAAITGVIALLSSLKAETWESDTLVQPKKYGLQAPIVEIDWELDSLGMTGSDRSAKPSKGRLRVGGQKPGTALFYAAVDGKKGVFTVSPFVLATLSREFHDRSITDFRLNDPRRAIFDWPGQRLIVDSRNDLVSKSRWRVAEFNGPAPIESRAIESLMEELSHLEASRFLQYSGAILDSAGLKQPRLTIQLFVQKGPRLQTIVLKIGAAVGESSLMATTAPESEGPTFLIPATETWREWLKLSPLVDEWPENVFAN